MTAQSRAVAFHVAVHHPKWGTALSPGPGDEVFVRLGPTSEPVRGTPLGPGLGPIRSFDATIPDGLGAAEIVFVRGGREHTLRTPLSAPAEIVAPNEIAKGDLVTIDLAPRPMFAEGTRVEVALNNLRATSFALPMIFDTATLERTGDADNGVLHVTVIADTARSKTVAGSGGLSADSSVLTSRGIERQLTLRF